jgi:voltage-gated potassium channel
LTYAGFSYLNEVDLTSSFISYAYYYVVTASTIGYGDMSPSSEYGQLFATLFLIPIAISIFATLITKAIATMTNEIQKIKDGFGDFSNTRGHTLVVGCNQKQTDKLLREIEASEVIVITSNEYRPSDKRVHIVRAESLASTTDLIRAGIKGAKCIVVMGKDDQETLLASLAVTSLVNTDRHVVAYFDSQATADILEANCKNIETVTDNSVAQVARSLDEPGASHVISNLVSNHDPVSLRSTPLNNTSKNNVWYVKHLAESMLRLNATLIGYGSKEHPVMILREGDIIPDHAIIYYIAEKDINLRNIAL